MVFAAVVVIIVITTIVIIIVIDVFVNIDLFSCALVRYVNGLPLMNEI